MGTAVGGGMQSYLEAMAQGDQLALVLVDMGPDGLPNTETARQVLFTRAKASATAPVAAPRGRGIVGSALATTQAAADPLVGTFSNGQITIVLQRSGSAYSGSFQSGGQQAPLQAQGTEHGLTGTIHDTDGNSYEFQSTVQNDVLVLTINGQQFLLPRAGSSVEDRQSAALQNDAAALVGLYQLEDSNAEILEIRADGLAMVAGELVPWAASEGVLALGDEVLPYRLEGNFLWLNVGMMEVPWTRISAAETAAPIPVTPSLGGGAAVGGPSVMCKRDGIPGVWVGEESSLDPQFFMSRTIYLTLFPNGSLGFAKCESGASRQQVSELTERFQSWREGDPTVQSVGSWQSIEGGIAIQFQWRPEPLYAQVDMQSMRMRVEGMGQLPGNEGGPMVFERQ